MLSTLRYIWNHPFARRHRTQAIGQFVRWQIVSRCLGGSAAVLPFTAKTQLYVTRRLHGATGNLYLGLHEFPEMAFLLHFLRPDDMFFDIGANVGTYTVLAAGQVNAVCVACEPVSSTFHLLRKNVLVNDVDQQVKTLMTAVGAAEGTVQMTRTLDAMNRVIEGNQASNATEVPVITLDQLSNDFQPPALVKIDVEGYETNVLRGASRTLASSNLRAIIIELNNGNIACCHDAITQQGFEPYQYDPYSRSLTPRASAERSENVIYVRRDRLDEVRTRLADAEPVHVRWESL